jgi:hypothetical protein
VGQIRVIFALPNIVKNELLPQTILPDDHFAYIEWFTPFQLASDLNHKMYKVSRMICHGQRVASIIPLSHIQGSIHLFPNFGWIAPRNWTNSNVLDLCSNFFVNSFTNRYIFSSGY